MSKDKPYEGGIQHIILDIPENTYKLKITAMCLEGNEEHKMKAVLGPDALYHARMDFLDYVGDDDYDAIYMLTDKGKEMLKETMEEGIDVDNQRYRNS